MECEGEIKTCSIDLAGASAQIPLNRACLPEEKHSESIGALKEAQPTYKPQGYPPKSTKLPFKTSPITSRSPCSG